MALPAGFETRRVHVNGVALSVVVGGPEAGPLVVLLHGFPESWRAWRHQLGPLASAGYRVVAPDQRGYAHSEKPAPIEAYEKDVLARDALALVEAFGRKEAFFVTHDWGGVVGWWLAIRYPAQVRKLVVMNLPHPAVFSRALRTLRQLRRSWYVFLFQLPWLPEWLLARDGFAWPVRILRSTSRPGSFPDDELRAHQAEWSVPGSLRGMLAWYRAAGRVASPPMPPGLVSPPVLVVWGEQDVALGLEMAAPSVAACRDGRLLSIPDGGHYVQHDAAEEVTRHVLAFLAE